MEIGEGIDELNGSLKELAVFALMPGRQAASSLCPYLLRSRWQRTQILLSLGKY